MSAFATWLAGHRIRRIVIIAGLFPLPLLGLVSSAVVVMAASLRGPREALIDCLASLFLLLGLGVMTGMDVQVLGVSAAVSWPVWIGLGALAGRTGSATLAVQAAVLLAVAGLLLFLAAIGDPVAYWQPILEVWYADLASQGLELQADLRQQAAMMSGALAAFALSGLLFASLLGLSWTWRITGRTLGEEFSQLRLGYVIGLLAAAAGVLALVGMPLNGALLIFGVAFAFQGAAVLAWWARKLDWPKSWWLALVILPLVFLSVLALELALLAALGFVDNWFSLRQGPPRKAE